MKKSTIIKRLQRCEADLRLMSSHYAELFDTLLTIAEKLNNRMAQPVLLHHQPDNTPNPSCSTTSGTPSCAISWSSDKKEISLYIQKGRFLLDVLLPTSQANPRQKINASRLVIRQRPLSPSMEGDLEGRRRKKSFLYSPQSLSTSPKGRKDELNHQDRHK